MDPTRRSQRCHDPSHPCGDGAADTPDGDREPDVEIHVPVKTLKPVVLPIGEEDVGDELAEMEEPAIERAEEEDGDAAHLAEVEEEGGEPHGL